MRALRISIRLLFSPLVVPIVVIVWGMTDVSADCLKNTLREYFMGKGK